MCQNSVGKPFDIKKKITQQYECELQNVGVFAFSYQIDNELCKLVGILLIQYLNA